MSMESSRRNVYFWILMTTLAHWVVECDKLEGYSFPVYNTTSCPRDQSEWRSRSPDLNCTENNGYMCIPNENITELLEFCYRYPRIPIEKGICLILVKSTSLVEAYSCKQFRNGCPDKQYWSNEIFEYPSCLSIGHRCFLAEPLCKDEGIATIGPSEVTQGTTNVYLGSTILNTSLGNTPNPDIDGSNTWVWILVIGVFLITVSIPVCALIFIFRRGNQKTLGEGHKEEETIPLKMDSSGERENFNMVIMSRKQFKEDIGEKKPDDNSLSDYVVEKQDNMPYIDETSNAAYSPSEDISKEEYSSSNKDVPVEINSYLDQQEGSDRVDAEKLKIADMYRDVYEIWKTEMSGK
ncbi:uncharacterized protein LOC134236628 [Saccostrea cucullata]|uniref:uncharacterized protein LOC134236628 n=1 Tax=Saccostrea cuccullata TaxID=36930 RepID=UPI002ED61C6A